MNRHTHTFVDTYQGLVGFGMDRETNEDTVMYYLQKFSDDTLMNTLKKRFDDGDLELLFEVVSGLLRKYLTEDEYHQLFLKDGHSHS